MCYLRNVLWFMFFALIISGCGGGNSTIGANDTTGSSTGTGSGGGSTGTGSGGSNNSGSGSNSGSVTLQWTPPTTMADGTTAISLSDISGYELFYGSSATNTPNSININDGTKTQYTVTLPTGSYYFVICAIDNNGKPGLKSSAIQKSIL